MDKDQFISIVKEHKNLIYKICHSYCADKNDHADLEQEILMQLWRAVPRFDGSVKMSTWIYRIALNTAISFYRKEHKRPHLESISYIELASAEYDLETDEHIRMLYQFIGQLNFLDKALILLYLDDTKYKDIAEILGISESNVATKINRIKNKLKTQFQLQNF